MTHAPINPFRSHIAQSAWETLADVPEIHAGPFERCRAALDHILHFKRTTSLLIHGQPGSGKTHLLDRLRRHVLCDDHGQQRFFIWVTLQTSARRLWRHLRHEAVVDLLRLSHGREQLTELLWRRFEQWRDFKGDRELFRAYVLEEFDESLDALDSNINSLALSRVLLSWLSGKHRAVAKGWLRGASLADDDLAKISLGPQPNDDDNWESESREVVVALSRLTDPESPLVICFDQIEALQHCSEDSTSLRKLGNVIKSLHDDTHNLLIVSCVQSQFVGTFRNAVGPANVAAAAEFDTCFLEPMQFEKARALIRQRLQAIPQFADSLRQNRNSVAPLTEKQVREIVGPNGCTPRWLLERAAVLFENVSGQRPPAEPLDVRRERFLQGEWDRRMDRHPGEPPAAETEAILSHGLSLLLHVACPDWRVGESTDRDIDLLVDVPDGTVGVSLCMQVNMTSLAARLRRLMEHQKNKPPHHKLLLFRDPRTPLTSTAMTTRERWKSLQNDGAVVVHPAVETLASLDALRKLLSDAKAGNLDFEGADLEEGTVNEWLKRNLADSLQELVNEITAAPEAFKAAPLFDPLNELLQTECLCGLSELAERLHASPAELQRCIAQHPQHFACIQSDPAVVYRQETANT